MSMCYYLSSLESEISVNGPSVTSLLAMSLAAAHCLLAASYPSASILNHCASLAWNVEQSPPQEVMYVETGPWWSTCQSVRKDVEFSDKKRVYRQATALWMIPRVSLRDRIYSGQDITYAHWKMTCEPAGALAITVVPLLPPWWHAISGSGIETRRKRRHDKLSMSIWNENKHAEADCSHRLGFCERFC